MRHPRRRERAQRGRIRPSRSSVPRLRPQCAQCGEHARGGSCGERISKSLWARLWRDERPRRPTPCGFLRTAPSSSGARTGALGGNSNPISTCSARAERRHREPVAWANDSTPELPERARRQRELHGCPLPVTAIHSRSHPLPEAPPDNP